MFSHRELHSRCSFLIPTTSSILLSFAYIVSSRYIPLTLWKYCEYLIMWANLPRDDQTLNARFVKGAAHGEKGFISLQGRACCAGRGPGNTGSCVLVPEFHAQGPVPLAHLLHAGLHLSTVDLLLLIRHPLGRTCPQSALGIYSPAGPAALGKAPVVINVRWARTPTRPLYADGTS